MAYAKLEEWFHRVRHLGEQGYAAGKVLDLSEPCKQHQWLGPDWSLRRLYVRKEFSSLYATIINSATSHCLIHLNGTPGIGKSAFLWYFLIRYANEKPTQFSILYQNGPFIWEFDSCGQVRVHQSFSFPGENMRKACWHLVNQKVGDHALGIRVLVAASPDPQNVKPAIANRREIIVRYLFPWDKEEFQCLLEVWKSQSRELRKKAQELVPDRRPMKRHRRASEDSDSEEDAEPDYDLEDGARASELDLAELLTRPETEQLSALKSLEQQANWIDARVTAAGIFFDWFGGAPGQLKQLGLE